MWLKIMHLALCNRCKWSYHLWDETGRTKILQKYWETKSLIRKLLMASTVDPNLRYLARQNYVFSWTRKWEYFNLPYNTIPTSIEKVDSRMRWLISLSHFTFQYLLNLLSFFDTLVFSTAYSEPFKYIQPFKCKSSYSAICSVLNTLVNDGQISGLIWIVLTTIRSKIKPKSTKLVCVKRFNTQWKWIKLGPL